MLDPEPVVKQRTRGFDQRIADGLNAAERAKAELKDADARVAEEIKKARAQAAEIIDKAHAQANQIVDKAKADALLEAARVMLHDRFAIEHCTLQVERTHLEDTPCC